MTVVDLVLQTALGIVLTAMLLRRDMRRSSRERLSRAWNDASFWCAVVVFGPLCVPVHFVRTRRTVLGLCLGLLWTVGIFAVVALVSTAVDALFGVT
jgi:hypothetical protein